VPAGPSASCADELRMRCPASLLAGDSPGGSVARQFGCGWLLRLRLSWRRNRHARTHFVEAINHEWMSRHRESAQNPTAEQWRSGRDRPAGRNRPHR